MAMGHALCRALTGDRDQLHTLACRCQLDMPWLCAELPVAAAPPSGCVQMKRLEAISRSPVLSALAESVAGVVTLRAFRAHVSRC
jgi:hypothetical protein